MNNNADELKRAALLLFRGMNFKVGQVVIDVNTAYNQATIKVAEIRKKIKEGDEVTVRETRIVK
jgi:hypothetical protein